MLVLRSQFLRLCVVCVLALPGLSAAQAKPTVLASIEPLALIAKELLGDRANVETLLPKGANPHQYALNIRDLKKIRSAQLLLWNGPVLEPYLSKSFKSLALENVSFPELLGLHPDHAHRHDPHYWLGPQNALKMAAQISDRLMMDADVFEAFARRQNELMSKWHAKMAPHSQQGLGVYHDGYSHLLGAFDLSQLAAVSAGEGRPISVKERIQIQQALKGKASCLVAEPYSEAQAAEKVAQKLGLNVIWLDPLASDVEVGGYHDWLDALLTDLLMCFE